MLVKQLKCFQIETVPESCSVWFEGLELFTKGREREKSISRMIFWGSVWCKCPGLQKALCQWSFELFSYPFAVFSCSVLNTYHTRTWCNQSGWTLQCICWCYRALLWTSKLFFFHTSGKVKVLMDLLGESCGMLRQLEVLCESNPRNLMLLILFTASLV